RTSIEKGRLHRPEREGVHVRIGVIGAGHIGGTAATLFARAGHEVAVSNSRGPDSLAPLVTSIGRGAHADSPEGAAKFGDPILLAIPWRRMDGLPPRDVFSGKIVIDARHGTSFDEPGAPSIRVHVPRTPHHRGRQDTRAGPALARVPSVQPRGTGRDAPDLSGDRPDERGPLPGGGSVRGDHPRAARVPTHRPGHRVPGRHRSRRVLVPRKNQIRIRRPFARPGTPWPKARLPFRARPRLLLRGSLRGSDRAHQWVWHPRPADVAGGLAALPAQRVGRGTGPHPVSAPALPELRRALSTLAREIPAIQGAIPRPAARVLPWATPVALGAARCREDSHKTKSILPRLRGPLRANARMAWAIASGQI